MMALGLILCRVLVVTGLRSLAPGACFGGDASSLGLDALLLLLIGTIAVLPLASRAKESSSVITVVGAMSVLAAGSAAIVRYFEY
jgi:hypothetical protein